MDLPRPADRISEASRVRCGLHPLAVASAERSVLLSTPMPSLCKSWTVDRMPPDGVKNAGSFEKTASVFRGRTARAMEAGSVGAVKLEEVIPKGAKTVSW